MSSSGSGGGDYGGGERSKELNCNIVERAALASPDPDVLEGLEKSDDLDVQLRSVGGRDSAVANTEAGATAGAILLSSVERTADLIECLRQGKRYKATVLTLKGALCTIEVRPRP
jgi:hypothetical protein